MSAEDYLKEREISVVTPPGTIDFSRPKWFGTFPYPYMNGPLHLGHAFTAAKVDFTARFKEMQGNNVLFPFGFHCTGSPIHAMASKLARDDPTVKAILSTSGVDDSEAGRFIDPAHWVSYFPRKGMDDMKKLHPAVDWSRSFYTTSLNPWYDSFIRWQFNKLKSLGYIEFGTRQSIVTPSDGLLCADHDRMIGEGVVPIKAHLVSMKMFGSAGRPSLSLLYLKHPDEKVLSPTSIEVDKNILWTQTHDGKLTHTRLALHLGSDDSDSGSESEPFCKLKDVIELSIKEVTPNGSWSWFERLSGFRITAATEDAGVGADVPAIITQVFVTNEQVISRTGVECVVRETEQWYIKYGDPEWKSRVKRYIEDKLETPNRLVKDQLLIAVEWLREWGFSRSPEQGLGTKIPWDDRFVIDSLSDSTIYMAYYTIAHLLTTDSLSVPPSMFTISVEELNDAFWENVFCRMPGEDVDSDVKVGQALITCLREVFRYWYPVDLRVSGKDLINNHLLMCLYNHIAIFGEELTPKTFSCNGYLTVDNVKMSKSTGNFVTLSDAISLYGLSPLRMALADAGDGLNDANFNTKNIKALSKHLTNAVKWHGEHAESYRAFWRWGSTLSGVDSILDRVFLNELIFYWKEALNAYELIRHKDALKHALFHFTDARETYEKHTKLLSLERNVQLLSIFSFMQVYLLFPIVPHVMEYVYQHFFRHSRAKYRDTVCAFAEKHSIDHGLRETCDLVDEIVSKANSTYQRLKSKPVASASASASASMGMGVTISVSAECLSAIEPFTSLIYAKITAPGKKIIELSDTTKLFAVRIN